MQTYRAFLDEVERNVPKDLDIHVVMNNASSHKTQMIQRWFAKRPRWHMHVTPTSSSWIHQVERVVTLLADKQITRGAHTSVKALIVDILRFIEQRNANPTPLRETRSAADILASIERYCQRTLNVHVAATEAG